MADLDCSWMDCRLLSNGSLEIGGTGAGISITQHSCTLYHRTMSRGNRSWMFTINNPSKPIDDPRKWVCVKYCIWQKEVGENGTPHLQGVVFFGAAIRLSTLKNKYHPTAHWEPRRGSIDEAIEYCSKEDTRVEGPWEFGTRPKPGQRNDLLELQKDLDDGLSMKEVSSNHFHPYLKYSRSIQGYRRLHQNSRTQKTFVGCIYGETGVGKSKLMAEKFPDAYWKSCGNQWWDDYDFQEVVIIDEYYGWLPYAYLLRLLDRYPMTVETKGGTVNFNPKQIWICSNNNPLDWYKWNDKMKPEPLERRIDFSALMKPNGTFEVRKGNNPFSTFPEPESLVEIGPYVIPEAVLNVASPPKRSPALSELYSPPTEPSESLSCNEVLSDIGDSQDSMETNVFSSDEEEPKIEKYKRTPAFYFLDYSDSSDEE